MKTAGADKASLVTLTGLGLAYLADELDLDHVVRVAVAIAGRAGMLPKVAVR